MLILDIKPLTVNEAYTGRKFKTPSHTKYRRDVCMLLPRLKIPEGFLSLTLEFGFSNSMSDIDNPVKPFIDCLQEKYGFNDRVIKELYVKAYDVEKGKEYIKFDLREMQNANN